MSLSRINPQSKVQGSITGKGIRIFLSVISYSQSRWRSHPAKNKYSGAVSPEIKLEGREAELSPASTAKVEFRGVIPPLPPPRLQVLFLNSLSKKRLHYIYGLWPEAYRGASVHSKHIRESHGLAIFDLSIYYSIDCTSQTRAENWAGSLLSSNGGARIALTSPLFPYFPLPSSMLPNDASRRKQNIVYHE
jgi:hypothetical protein